MLDISLYVLLLMISLAAVALNILSLPGNWIMLAAATAWSCYHAWHIPSWQVLALMLLALLGAEALELLGSVVGARTFGASRTASAASIVGAIIGALAGTFIPIPVIGNIVGAILGAFLAAWSVEMLRQKPLATATKAAFGAALGRGAGLVTKISVGLAVWLALAFFGFPK